MHTGRIRTWGEAHFGEPAPPRRIEALERDVGHPLPLELRELLLEADGIEGEYGLGLL
ncbi:hypothetical protein [Knoellia sp. LjRoot47]|uniref:hypothetical protein n=1 Tax=Knoellia sp. LjRoot47 TaxID=3342330 RepID=UPI003ED0DD89